MGALVFVLVLVFMVRGEKPVVVVGGYCGGDSGNYRSMLLMVQREEEVVYMQSPNTHFQIN